MRLQVSLDRVTTVTALDLLKDLYDVVDIAEVGTPFIVREGIRAITQIKENYPDLTILADLKAMDGGAYEAEMAIGAGAKIVTVLAVANDSTIAGAVDTAHRMGGEVLVDMIEVRDLETRARQIQALGVDYICVHTAKDVQNTGKTPLDDLRRVKRAVPDAKIAVAGGINQQILPWVVVEQPAILIVGKGITGATRPREAALQIKSCL